MALWHPLSVRGHAAFLLALCSVAMPAAATPLNVTSCFCSLSSDAEVVETLVSPVQVTDPKGPTSFTTGASFLQSNAATEHDLLAQGRAEADVTIGSNLLAANGWASMSLDRPANVPDFSSADASASVTARWTFDVLVDSLFTLVGLLDTTTTSTGIVQLMTANNIMQLVRLDAPALLFSALTDDEAFSVNGVLPAGRYRLSAESKVNGLTRFAGSASAEARYEFSLQLAPLTVPEPTALWLVVLAATLLGTVGTRATAGPGVRRRCSRRLKHDRG